MVCTVLQISYAIAHAAIENELRICSISILMVQPPEDAGNDAKEAVGKLVEGGQPGHLLHQRHHLLIIDENVAQITSEAIYQAGHDHAEGHAQRNR